MCGKRSEAMLGFFIPVCTDSAAAVHKQPMDGNKNRKIRICVLFGLKWKQISVLLFLPLQPNAATKQTPGMTSWHSTGQEEGSFINWQNFSSFFIGLLFWSSMCVFTNSKIPSPWQRRRARSETQDLRSKICFLVLNVGLKKMSVCWFRTDTVTKTHQLFCIH